MVHSYYINLLILLLFITLYYIFYIIIIFTHSRLNSKYFSLCMAGRIFSLLACCPDIFLAAEKIHKGKNVLKCVEMCALDEQIPISGFDIV